jgi:hypothetical protein
MLRCAGRRGQGARCRAGAGWPEKPSGFPHHDNPLTPCTQVPLSEPSYTLLAFSHTHTFFSPLFTRFELSYIFRLSVAVLAGPWDADRNFAQCRRLLLPCLSTLLNCRTSTTQAPAPPLTPSQHCLSTGSSRLRPWLPPPATIATCLRITATTEVHRQSSQSYTAQPV